MCLAFTWLFPSHCRVKPSRVCRTPAASKEAYVKDSAIECQSQMRTTKLCAPTETTKFKNININFV